MHAEKQIEAGGQAIQIFDSWAGLLPEKELYNYCYIPTLKIVEHIKNKKVPIICFPTDFFAVVYTRNKVFARLLHIYENRFS